MIQRQSEWASCATELPSEAPNENIVPLSYRREMGRQQLRKSAPLMRVSYLELNPATNIVVKPEALIQNYTIFCPGMNI